MSDKLQELREKIQKDLSEVKSVEDLKNIRVQYLGKKGALTSILRSLGTWLRKNGRRSARWSMKSGPRWNSGSMTR